MEKYLFWGAFFFAYTMQAITGFAGNIMAMPVGTATIGMDATYSVLNIMGCLACGAVALANLKHVAWREFATIIVVMTIFMFVGIWLNTQLQLNVLLKIFGVLVLGVGTFNLALKQRPLLPEKALWAVLVLAGIIQGMFVSGGAFLVIYALQKIQDKEQFRVTLSLVWAVLNGIYAVVEFQAGHVTGEVGGLLVVCIPLAIAAVVLGQRIERRMSQTVFLKITYVLLVLIGVLLLVR